MAIKHYCDRCGKDIILPADIVILRGEQYVMQTGIFRIEVLCFMVDAIKPGELPQEQKQTYRRAELCCSCISIIAGRGERETEEGK